CEAYNYDVSPDQEDKKGDRIVVLEDTDRDGKADRRTVFYQGTDVNTPLGIFAAGNQVFVTRSPNLLVFTDTDGDLVADKKEMLFTNMGKKGDHSAHSIFFGPDGKYYFSVGNHAGEIQDKNGRPIVDRAGFAVTQKGEPYLGGMVLRFGEDGKDFEVIGHNFRNNYEPCIDAYGNVWQSDNDDDGYESTRINFVMPYGNYGYLDEMTKASWRTNRVNLEEHVPDRHWHQNDPGAVPNVLVTGAGSPAGMAFYEGELLPKVFRHTPVHAEPYYNVVRSYVPEKIGAGYTAAIKDILKSQDQWFRPVDVCTAPDGSLIIADWYDPILGGGAAGDANRGRIYRVAPDVGTYHVEAADLSSAEGAVDALKNPNIETRYLAWQVLRQADEKAMPALQQLWRSENPVFKARALWLLGSYEDNDEILREALQDKNPDIRIAAIKAVLQHEKNAVSLLSTLATDPDPGVRREVATALRYNDTPEGAKVWVTLAKQYDGTDRWYLEALGIGADLHADLYFDAWRKAVTIDLKNKAHQDIIWRSRSEKALPFLADLIKQTDERKAIEHYFRAFDFHKAASKTVILSSLVGLSGNKGKELSALALLQMDGWQVKMTPAIRRALEDALQETKGTIEFVDLIGKFRLKDKSHALLALSIEEGGSETGAASTDLLLKFKGTDLIRKALARDDNTTLALLQSMKGKGSPDVIALIKSVVADSTRATTVRQAAVQVMGTSWPGEEQLLSMVKQTGFPGELKPAAAAVLFNVYRSAIQREAEQYLTRPSVKGTNLSSIKQLLASSGNEKNGNEIFKKYCATCHRIGEVGVKFGPELTQIGDKLDKEGLYRAILYPDEGISNGYESVLITLSDGTQSMGVVASETDAAITLTMPGGGSVTYAKDRVQTRERSDRSIMPALAAAMTEQELVDLVQYLSDLKKGVAKMSL
ncbi:MAG TPA: PVC-type heme-binding CxxCH protein, partial [Ohtaekwangia sp.]|nr:PVC-type heme-binding CxxCH protein [Ohtaekwangia sp.]